MGKWEAIYQNLENRGVDVAEQLAGTTWLDRFIPYFNQTRGNMLDLGCGLGADMLRCAKLGYEPYGLDLEAQAVEFVAAQYGFYGQRHDFGDPLPFDDGMFSLVLSRFALHYLRPAQAQVLFGEIGRVLEPRGQLLFVVNSESHRRLGLQYDYTEATELEPHVWYLPNDKEHTFLFCTSELAKELVGEGWQWDYLEDEVFEHWDGIEKRAIIGFAQKT
jgi:SAM-dependent methyltransferase